MDWKKVLKELNDPNLHVVKRRLRRIHLRWYHATASRTTRLLEMIGGSESTLKLIPDVVATCRFCRTWTRQAPDVKLAVRLSIRFNQCVQVDPMFYECVAMPIGSSSPFRAPTQHIILHMVDECIRWSVAVDIPTKNVGYIIEAIELIGLSSTANLTS